MKKYNNILFIVLFLLLSFPIFIFNKIMDPYNLCRFSTENTSFSTNEEPRDLIYIFLKHSKNRKYNTIIVGASATSCFFTTEFYEKFTKSNVFSCVLNSLSPEEQYLILKDYLELHPETKNVIVEVSVHPYIQYHSSINYQRYTKISDYKIFFKLYYSIDATKKSLMKFLSCFSKSQEEKEYYETYPDAKYEYPRYPEDKAFVVEALKNNIQSLMKIKQLLDEKKVNAIYFAPPKHALHLSQCYIEETYNYIELVKRKIAEVVPFYDMAFVSKYTTYLLDGELCFYYHDVFHPSFLMSKDIFDVIIFKKNNNELSTFITRDNIESELKKQKRDLEKYIKENKEYVDSYMNIDFDYRRSNNTRMIKSYYKDMPQEVIKTYW